MARRPISRKVERTTLGQWKDRQQLSYAEVGALLGVSGPAVYHWCSGRSLPTLIMAFHIEAVTDNEVPASSWVATQLGLFELAGYEEKAARTQAPLVEKMKKRRALSRLTEVYRRELEANPFRKVEVSVLDGEEEVLSTKAVPPRSPIRPSKASVLEELAPVPLVPKGALTPLPGGFGRGGLTPVQNTRRVGAPARPEEPPYHVTGKPDS